MTRILALLVFVSAQVSGSDFKPNIGPDLESITVTCGDVTMLLRQASQWTPGRFDYKGKPMTTEKSAYGTVFSFPETGFIGTAHLENEPEELKSLRFYADDQEIPTPTSEITAKTFRLERESKIRTFQLTNVIEIQDNKISETATIKTDEATPLKLVYHFMHAWKPTCSAFISAAEGESETLKDTDDVARLFYINQPVDWMAIYEPESSQYAVSRLIQFPDEAKPFSKLWNVPGTYRKYYLQSFSNATVPAGFEGTWKMVTAFGSSSVEDWTDKAKGLAGSLESTR